MLCLCKQGVDLYAHLPTVNVSPTDSDADVFSADVDYSPDATPSPQHQPRSTATASAAGRHQPTQAAIAEEAVEVDGASTLSQPSKRTLEGTIKRTLSAQASKVSAEVSH